MAVTHKYACADTLATFSSLPSCASGAFTFAGGESLVDQNVNFNASPNTTYYVSFTYSGTGSLCVGVGNDASGYALISGSITAQAFTKGASASNSLSLDDRGGGVSKCASNPGFVGTISNVCITDTSGACESGASVPVGALLGVGT